MDESHDYISEQPSEIIFKVCDYLDKRSLEALRCTSTKINKKLKDYLVLTEQQHSVLQAVWLQFQKEDGRYIRLNTGTGTGKTMMTLHFIQQLTQKGKRCLIITKNVLKYVWRDEVTNYNVPGRCINMKILENPPARSSLERKIEHLKLQLKNQKVVLLGRTPLWTGIPKLKLRRNQAPWYEDDSNRYYVPYSALVDNWNKIKPQTSYLDVKGIKREFTKEELDRLKGKQLFLDTILTQKWDLVVYDDIKPAQELKRLIQFNPRLRCLCLEAKYTIKKGVVGKYQSDSDLGHIPKIEVDYVSYLCSHGEIGNITTILLDLIKANSESKVLLALCGLTNLYGASDLAQAVKSIQKMKLAGVYFLGNKKAATISQFSSLKKGILIGGWNSLAKGHNIFPEKIYLLEDVSSSVTINIKYQLMGRIKRAGSPYQTCLFSEIRFSPIKVDDFHDLRRWTLLKMISKQKNTKSVYNPFGCDSDDWTMKKLFDRLNSQLLFSLDDLGVFFNPRTLSKDEQRKQVYVCFKFVNLNKKDQLQYYEKNKNSNGLFWLFLNKMSAKYNHIRSNYNSEVFDKIEAVCKENGVSVPDIKYIKAQTMLLFLMMSHRRCGLLYAWARDNKDQVLSLYRSQDKKALEKNKLVLKECMRCHQKYYYLYKPFMSSCKNELVCIKCNY